MASTQAKLANGRTITVDNTQIDIKFTRSAQQLNDSLSRAQTSLGLYYDGQRRLVDVLGRCVEGLSLSQIRLGMRVDETGKRAPFLEVFRRSNKDSIRIKATVYCRLFLNATGSNGTTNRRRFPKNVGTRAAA